MWNNVVNAWWSIAFYPATNAPKFRKGMIAMLCACVATLAVTLLVYYLERREWRITAQQTGHGASSSEELEVESRNGSHHMETADEKRTGIPTSTFAPGGVALSEK